MDPAERISDQLREATQLTNATWSVLAERIGGSWVVRAAYHLNQPARSTLSTLLEKPAVDAWLCGALTGGHSRSGTLPLGSELGADRFFAYPVEHSSKAILVGATELTPEAQRLWRLAAALLTPTPSMAAEALPDLQSGLSQDLPLALERALGYFVRAVSPQGAWLAIMRGELLEIQAEWNDPRSRGTALEFEAYPILQRMRRTRSELAVSPEQPDWELLPQGFSKAGMRQWICIPLVLSQRLIGAVALWHDRRLDASEWSRLRELALRLAPFVEVNVTFAEMGGHLRRLAMLNDFVLTISSAQNLDELVRRAFALMSRVFGTELLSLFVLTGDRKLLREFRLSKGKLVSSFPVAESEVLRAALERGVPARIGDMLRSGFPPVHATARSALLVPLRHRGTAIGAISIESPRLDSFTQFDEHLMVVIAGHLASLIEYGRLREEAEGRARNLGLIHEVVQAIIGTSTKADIAQISADLVAQYFRYELTAVLLEDETEGGWIRGFGGARGQEVAQVLARSGPRALTGIPGRVLQTGESLLLNDVSDEADYVSLGGWTAGSEMCVALSTGDRIRGIIDITSSQSNAFTANDLVAMESLAGILASVISSAEHRQRLQLTVNQLRSTEEELKTRMEALQAAEERLVHAAKLAAVGEMAAGIAHELNNPLTTVTGFSELLLSELPVDAAHRSDVELVLREARRAGDVVRQLLDFARQGDRLRVLISLNDVVRDVVALTSHLIRTSGVSLELKLLEDLPSTLVDKNQLQQVVLNLIHNALQAMPGGGALEIGTAGRARDGRSWAVCWVQDSGTGIEPALRERIFEPFFTTRGDRGGTGLGLSVSYGIVTDHGGKLEVESEPGHGSVFSIWLPV